MESLATRYVVRMSEAKTMDELRILWSEIVADRTKLGEWFSWLQDFKDGQKIRLQPEEEPTWLTKEGLKKWKS